MPCDNVTSSSRLLPIPQRHYKPHPHPPLFFMQDPGLDGDCGCQSAWLVCLLPFKLPLK